MNDLHNELDSLFDKINSIMANKNFEGVDSLEKLKEICDSSVEMSSIFEFEEFFLFNDLF